MENKITLCKRGYIELLVYGTLLQRTFLNKKGLVHETIPKKDIFKKPKKTQIHEKEKNSRNCTDSRRVS